VLAGALVSTGVASLSSGRAATPANVILISIDCLNHRQLEAAWQEGRAPALAPLAQDALVLDRAYVHAPWTPPSPMSLLTGLHPSEHGHDIPCGLLLEQPLGGEAAVALERRRSRLTEEMSRPPRYRRVLADGRQARPELDDASREALRALGYVQ